MKYTIGTSVESVSGTQWWTVEADSEAEALAKFRRDGGEFVDEEIEVTSTGEPFIIKQ